MLKKSLISTVIFTLVIINLFLWPTILEKGKSENAKNIISNILDQEEPVKKEEASKNKESNIPKKDSIKEKQENDTFKVLTIE